MNKTKTIQIRMTENDYNDLKDCAFMMGTTVSKLNRQLIQVALNSYRVTRKANPLLKQAIPQNEGQEPNVNE